MPPRRGYRNTSRRAPRRKTAWVGGLVDPATLGAGGQGITNLFLSLPDKVENPFGRTGLTVMRTYMTLRVNSTDATFSAEGVFGLVMVDGDAFAGGSVPDPAQG